MDDAEKNFQKALNKAAALLARRNHSEKELREKLLKFYDADLTQRVLQEAWERKWLLPPEELSVLAAKAWTRAHKSARYIQEQLKKRGLPLPVLDEEEELQKMKDLLIKKFRAGPGSDSPSFDWDYEQRVKAFRYLKYRGFAERLIRQVIHGDF
jgi:regulatory protein